MYKHCSHTPSSNPSGRSFFFPTIREEWRKDGRGRRRKKNGKINKYPENLYNKYIKMKKKNTLDAKSSLKVYFSLTITPNSHPTLKLVAILW